MKVFTYKLKEDYPVLGGELECMIAGNPCNDHNPSWRRPAVIVVPGGGYQIVASAEGEPIASYFQSRGFHTFILTYLTIGMFNEGNMFRKVEDKIDLSEVRYPEHLVELGSAVDYVRKHAEEFHVNPNEIFVVGFSAGGHLVGNLAVEYASVGDKVGVALDCKPTAVGLSYPVITNEEAHGGSHFNLLQGYTEEAKAELLKTLNLDKAVTEKTAPAYIWTTAEDDAVPAVNSLRFAMALARHNVPYELHVYAQGRHGLSDYSREHLGELPKALERNAGWRDHCVEFFRLFIEEKF